MARKVHVPVWLLFIAVVIARVECQFFQAQNRDTARATAELKTVIANQVEQLVEQFKLERSEYIEKAKKQNANEIQAVREMYAKRLEERDTRIARLENMEDPAHCANKTGKNVQMIVFSARIESFTAPLTSDSRIPFNLIDVNIGGAYFNNGSFIAPIKGLYAFSFEVTPSTLCGDKRLCVGVYHNSKLTSTSCCRSPNSCGTTVNVQLAADSELWLAVSASDSECHQLMSGSQYNKFVGNLRHPDK